MAALAIERRSEIIERLQTGERVNEIAASFGITGPAITQYLSHDPEYQAARESGTERILDKAEDAIDRAEDPLSLARARESWKAKSWRAEREFAHRWGARPTTAVQVNTSSITLVERVIVRPSIDAQVVDSEGLIAATGVMSNAIHAPSASVHSDDPEQG